MNQLLFVASCIILLCIILSKFSNRIGIPSLLFFIILGIAFTHPNILNIPFQNFELIEKIATISLIFIMFYGGFNTRWQEAKKVAKESILLSTIGVALTAILTALGIHWFIGLGIGESLLIGSVISSTDAASVFSIIRSKKLALRHHTGALLELESGSNDPASYLLTLIAIQLLQSKLHGLQMIIEVLLQLSIGLLGGYLVFKISYFLLKRNNIIKGMDNVFIFSMAALAYSLVSILRGNGYLAVYIFGIMLGQTNINNKINLVHFFDGLTQLMQMLLFFSLGFLSEPNQIARNLGLGFSVFLIISLLVRPLIILSLMAPFKAPMKQRWLVSFAGLRGAASIVFAIMAHNQLPNISIDIFHIVFVVVLFSILIQGALLPWFSTKLTMTDDLEDPLKTFNDYAESRPIEFITFYIKDDHHLWANKTLKEITIQDDLLIVLIKRNREKIVPDGNTFIRPQDKVVCIAKSFLRADEFVLKEEVIDESSLYLNRPFKELSNSNKLFVLIKRDSEYIIPNGSNQLLIGDEVIYLEQ